jgi:hypothetical protein
MLIPECFKQSLIPPTTVTPPVNLDPPTDRCALKSNPFHQKIDHSLIDQGPTPPDSLAAMVPKDLSRGAGVKYKEEPTPVADDPVSTAAPPSRASTTILFVVFSACAALQSPSPTIVSDTALVIGKRVSRQSRHGHRCLSTTTTTLTHCHSFSHLINTSSQHCTARLHATAAFSALGDINKARKRRAPISRSLLLYSEVL